MISKHACVLFWRKTLALSSKAIHYINILEKAVQNKGSQWLGSQDAQILNGPMKNTYHLYNSLLCSISLLPYFISLLGKCRKHVSLDAVWVQVSFLYILLLEEIIPQQDSNVHL